MRWFTRGFIAVVLAVGSVLGVAVSANAADNPVLDGAEVFSADQKIQLADFIHTADDKYKLVFVVETVPSLSGKDIHQFAVDRANQLGIGNAKTSNGVYMLIAPNDHKVQIELGSGVSPVISDQQVVDLISTDVAPHFRNKDWYGGTTAGITKVGDLYVTPAPVQTVTPAPADYLTGFLIIGGAIVGIIALPFGIVLGTLKIKDSIQKRRKEKALLLENARLNFIKNLSQQMRNRDYRDSFESLKNADQRKQAVLKLFPDLSARSGYFEDWYSAFIKDYMDVRRNSVLNSLSLSSRDMLSPDLRDNETISSYLSGVLEHGKRTKKRLAEQMERDRKAREEQARKREKDQKNADKFWTSLTAEQKQQVKRARTRSEKERLLTSYGVSQSNLGIWFPLLLTMYVSEIGRPESSSYGSSYSHHSSSSSSSSYDSGSSFSSGFSSFGGGDFGGGGGGGSF